MKIFRNIITALLLSISFVAASAGVANAFNPNTIISDSVFTNKNTMSVSDIQNFLNSKVPTCDTWHSPGSGSQGNQPPWTCLRSYSEGGRTAAQIIYDAAQTYNINPQVIIVTLQKENGLITDTWPYHWQYRTAMGMGCPDGAPCDSQYYGFANQVNQGVRHLKNFYDQNPNWYIPHRAGVNNVKFHPNTGCGTSQLNINKATSALYSYTPYQPNGAALNNMYGTGDGCSSYGNRNFWRDFTNWFGNTLGQPYAWELVSQSYSSGTANITASGKVTLTVVARNTGTAAWYNTGNNPVKLGAVAPNDRSSSFYDPSWHQGATRPALLQESVVPPGQTGTFQFQVQAPGPGTYQERFSLVAEYASWFNDPGMYFTFNVANPTFAAEYVNSNIPDSIASDTAYDSHLTFRNTGNTTWYRTGNAVPKIGVYNGTSLFADPSWENPSRVATLAESSVAPGQNGTFYFKVRGPGDAETYPFVVQPLIEGWSWINTPYSKNIQVTSSYGASASTTNEAFTMIAGETVEKTVSLTNIGTETWQKSSFPQVRLGTGSPFGRSSAFQDSTWPAFNRAANLNENSVAPNSDGTFTFNLKAPGQPGQYTEVFNPVVEGIKWLKTAVTYSINVEAPRYSWSVVSQSYSNGSVNVSPGQTAQLTVVARNTGNTTWTKNGDFPVKLATSNQRDRNSAFKGSGWLSNNRAALLTEDSVAPGQNGTFTFNIKVPANGGAKQEHFSLIAEGKAWMNDPGMYFYFDVKNNYSWQLMGQTYSSGSATMATGDSQNLTVTARNVGSATWYKNSDFPVKLGTTNPRNRTSGFYNPGWLDAARPAAMTQDSVAPGENATFTFPITAPGSAGVRNEYFSLITEGVLWMNDPGMYFYLNVQ